MAVVVFVVFVVLVVVLFVVAMMGRVIADRRRRCRIVRWSVVGFSSSRKKGHHRGTTRSGSVAGRRRRVAVVAVAVVVVAEEEDRVAFVVFVVDAAVFSVDAPVSILAAFRTTAAAAQRERDRCRTDVIEQLGDPDPTPTATTTAAHPTHPTRPRHDTTREICEIYYSNNI